MKPDADGAPAMAPSAPPRTGPEPAALASVVIPNYNHGRYLRDAIRSVLEQQYAPVETIVVDDGSTEDTDQIVRPFLDRIHYHKQPNRGLSAARNAGLRLARGKYVSFLDADDMYEANSLSTLIARLHRTPGAQGAYASYRFVDPSNQPLPENCGRVVPPDQLYDVLLTGNFLVPEAVLMQRECYDESGAFDESLDACEDWDMWLRLAKRHTIVGTEEVLSRHRVLPGSMSSDPARMLRFRLEVLQKQLGGDEASWTNQERRAWGGAYLRGTIEYLRSGDEQRSYDCFRSAAQVSPDLLGELEPFYELACAHQAPGYGGDFATWNLESAAATLRGFLHRLFTEEALVASSRARHAEAQGNAFLSLGLLSYGARRFRWARRFLLQALARNPRLLIHPQLAGTLLRAVPREVADSLRLPRSERG